MHTKQNSDRKRGLLLKGIALTVFVSFCVAASVSAEDLDGKAVFEKRCTGCHALDADHEGPRLRGVVGRRAGSVQTFEYSKAMQTANFTWDATLLEKWLTDTNSRVPGNDMSFRVSKPEERAAIVAYLKTLTP
jgi:cytochrome c